MEHMKINTRGLFPALPTRHGLRTKELLNDFVSCLPSCRFLIRAEMGNLQTKALGVASEPPGKRRQKHSSETR